MKRRHFIATAGTIGLATTVSSASVLSSTYTSISQQQLLNEFEPKTRKVLDKFMAEVLQNTQELGLDQKYAAWVALPTRIKSKASEKGFQSIIFQNKSGQLISLTIAKGVERIEVL